jgi:hypothetical protein
MRITFLLLFLYLLTSAHAQERKEIRWTDLESKLEFDDPFAKLSRSQLVQLGRYARMQEKQEKLGDEFSNEDQIKKDSMRQGLLSQNIKIDSLLMMRAEITELRRQKAEEVNTKMNNVEIWIAGYLLPLNYIDGKVTECLLVPWVGACIHTPPPPKNQLIYITVPNGLKSVSRFAAVIVEGLITTTDKTSSLFLVDGRADISSGYSMLDAKVSKFK